MSKAAVFDLDGTLTYGDMYVAFLAYMLRIRPRRVAHCLALPVAALRFALGGLPNAALKSRALAAVLGGCEREGAERDGANFVAGHLDRMVKPQALARIDWHRREGHRLVLASASLDLYAVPIGAALGFADVVCTRLASPGGRITGALEGDNLRGATKLTAVSAVLETAGAELAHAYSDHRSDLPLLQAAQRGVAVDPDAGFAAEALRCGLTVEDWGGRWGRARTVVAALCAAPDRRRHR
jgi:HAD superfamily hydrolase (TIGR01490 family)